MKFDYEIFPRQRLILARYRGAADLPALRASAERMWSDSRYDRSFDGVVDLADDALRLPVGDFRALVEFLLAQERTSRGRWAAIASSPIATALGLLYQRALGGRHAFTVHSSWEAACGALHLRPTPAMTAWMAEGEEPLPAA